MRVPLTVRDFLDRAELVHPNRVGLVDEPGTQDSLGELSWGEIARRAQAYAAGFDELGIGVGDRIAVVSQNSARLQELLFAAPYHGRVLVPVNFRLHAEEVRYIVEHSGADVLLVDPELSADLSSLAVKHRFVIGRESDDALLRFDAEPAPVELTEDDTATINYTSGTTARPKGVQLSHRTIWTNAVTFGLHVGVGSRDVFLHTLPMFHCNGWGMPYVLGGFGVKQVVLRKVDGAEILRRVQQHGVTLACGAPAVWNAVLDAAADWSGEIPGRDRMRVVCAGAPPPSRTIQRIGAELGWEFQQIYGLTETAPLLTHNVQQPEDDDKPAEERARLLSRAGAPALGVRVAIDDSGEVLARSNNVMIGYWNDPDATGRALDGGWFHTGDGGVLSDGYVAISDRKKDVIISGGENVSSIEVEDRLYAHPAVSEAAVIGIPDAKWGELVMGVVVLNPGEQVSEADMIAHCKAALAGYKVPKRIEFVDELPRTATGKTQKFRLRQPYWTGRDRQVN
jgi:acyl-CoA synthetase (AMP-forming)/AMP-acid ligase II